MAKAVNQRFKTRTMKLQSRTTTRLSPEPLTVPITSTATLTTPTMVPTSIICLSAATKA